ncbi:hypothetical protein QAD02_010146 [Eretmocerus hayati]|uniref:Uncharacterized protein n=1 Tax=Eretmocerus hayati TaxID=131215 RepID=A0ACC2NBH7_9HYME|nr:hypothetical protein QAD02_010146 [Eretmocerus hayati]
MFFTSNCDAMRALPLVFDTFIFVQLLKTENISVLAKKIRPHQRQSIAAIVHGDIVLCSGSMISKSLILTSGVCIEEDRISELRIKFHGSRKFPVKKMKRSIDEKIAILLIKGSCILKRTADVLDIVDWTYATKLPGPVTLHSWTSGHPEDDQFLDSVSFELTKVQQSSCPKNMLTQKLDEHDLCARLSNGNMDIYRTGLYTIGAPIVQNGTLIGVASTFIDNSFVMYRNVRFLEIELKKMMEYLRKL